MHEEEKEAEVKVAQVVKYGCMRHRHVPLVPFGAFIRCHEKAGLR